jgi:aspartate aminotransferase
MKEILVEPQIETIVMPENLKIAAIVSKHRKMCASIGCDFDYYGFAFGQSPFPLPPILARALAEHAEKGNYCQAEGIAELREAIAGFNKRHFGLDLSPSRIMIGPGTKSLIHAVFSVVKGGVIIPSPSWIGYLPLITLLGKHSHTYHLRPESEYRILPQELDKYLDKIPDDQNIFVLNNPHNPTGNVYSQQELMEIAEVCRKHNTLVLADEIYALMTYDFEKFISMGLVYPEGTFITNGLSKDRSAGGYRLGSLILPENSSQKLADDFKKVAATMYTNVSTPTQYAAIAAYAPTSEIEEYFRVTRQIHRITGKFMSEELNRIGGIKATEPDGGFYLFADFNELSDDFRKKGVKNSNGLGQSLISHPFHIATLTGDACLLRPEDFGARIAFVDYRGEEPYKKYRERPPRTKSDENEFVRTHAPRMVEGIEALKEYVSSMSGN